MMLTNEEKTKLENEIKELEQITREKDGNDNFAQAQFNLGVIYKDLGQKEKAIDIWQQIQCEDNLEAYAKAQFNIGVVYDDLGQKEKAIDVWQQIQRKDNPEQYAKAQFNIGITYHELGQKEKAIEAWQNIQREDYLQAYVKAQFNIGVVYNKLGQKEKAIDVWQQIQRKDNPEQYARAQFNIGITYHELGQKEKAIEAWQNIQREDNLEAYANAQFNLGMMYYELEQLENSLFHFTDSFQAKNSFHTLLYMDILELCKKSEYKQLFLNYISLLKCVKDIRNTLQVDFKIELHENKLAHYTDVNVVNKLLNGESLLRLNKIYGMNDPTEGDILFKYLHDELNQNDEYSNIAYTPFITCFTMNHDKLNQFRLYGKSDGKEATGISLVVNQYFFSTLPDEDFSFIKISGNIKNELSKGSKITESLKAQPVYRCIYIDPESGYIKLAQRDKITFYREHSKDVKQSKTIDDTWDEYQKYIHDKERKIKEKLDELKTKIENILDYYEQDKQKLLKLIKQEQLKLIKQEQLKLIKQEQLKLIELILLPLRYLVKHAAFEDEQECRMCYITSLDDPCVEMDFDKKWLYVEYEIPVKNCVSNVYIATGAKDYYPFIVKLLGDSSKVKLSSNPFRT